MVISLHFKSNGKDVDARLGNLIARQMPFAVVSSLTKTATQLNKANKSDMTRIFNNPTAWTKNAFRVDPARMKPYTPLTKITRKTKAGSSSTNTLPNRQHYLEVQENGGARPPKAFESAIRSRGRGAKNFMYATPTSQTRTTVAGNVSKNTLNKYIEGIGVQGGKFFIPKSNHPLALKSGMGIFERMAKNKVRKRMHLHNTTPVYSPAFKFARRMRSYGKKLFPKVFKKQLTMALATARYR